MKWSGGGAKWIWKVEGEWNERVQRVGRLVSLLSKPRLIISDILLRLITAKVSVEASHKKRSPTSRRSRSLSPFHPDAIKIHSKIKECKWNMKRIRNLQILNRLQLIIFWIWNLITTKEEDYSNLLLLCTTFQQSDYRQIVIVWYKFE